MALPALYPAREHAAGRLEPAIVRTLAYFSIFGYTPSLFDLHRYLHGETATSEQVRAACRRPDMARSTPLPEMPPGSASLRFSLTILKCLPFVRMIGLTGSMAVQPDGAGDTDLMIVAAPGRVWLCRLAAVALARFARLFGNSLCPNYLVAADSLPLGMISIYDAHELAQLRPLYGSALYQRLWELNPWVEDLLPNAHPFPCPPDRLPPGAALLKRAGEWVLGSRLGDRLERWERERKIARLQALGVNSPEVSLTASQCKGHFDGHRRRTLSAYNHLLSRIGEG